MSIHFQGPPFFLLYSFLRHNYLRMPPFSFKVTSVSLGPWFPSSVPGKMLRPTSLNDSVPSVLGSKSHSHNSSAFHGVVHMALVCICRDETKTWWQLHIHIYLFIIYLLLNKWVSTILKTLLNEVLMLHQKTLMTVGTLLAAWFPSPRFLLTFSRWWRVRKIFYSHHLSFTLLQSWGSVTTALNSFSSRLVNKKIWMHK